MRVITAQELLRHGACSTAVALFRDTFGESVEVTPETWAHARAAGLPVDWCRWLLSAAQLAAHDREWNALFTTYNAERERIDANTVAPHWRAGQWVAGSYDYTTARLAAAAAFVQAERALLFRYLTTDPEVPCA